MSAIGQALFWKLSNDTNVTALVGKNILPEYLFQRNNTYPAIIYEANADTDRDRTYAGFSGYAKSRAIIRCIGRKYSDADALASAVINSLDDQFGNWNGLTVQRCFYMEIEEDETVDPTSEKTLLYIQNLTFDLHLTLK